MRVPHFISKFKILHLLFWLVVAGIWFYLRYQDYPTLQQATAVTIIKVIDLAILMYFANLFLVPRLLYRKKYGQFFLAFVGCTLAMSLLKMTAVAGVLEKTVQFTKEAIYNNFVTQFFLVLASIGLKSVFDYLQLQKKMAEISKEKAEAELNFLKSQINPHFLFNSLNAVYFLIEKENVLARNALHKFSEMLRYQLYECNGEKIPIEKEIGFLNDYVGLQSLRMNEHTSVKFNCAPDVSSFNIEPLLLVPFVENSFKHLSHYQNDRRNEVEINISRNNGSMIFSVYNTTEGTVTDPSKGGIGLNNVRKRLQLLYPGKHDLKIKEENGWFGVELNLSIN